MTLVVPSYVPLHKLASASGIQMLINGIFMLCAGPILGTTNLKFNYLLSH